MPGTIPVRVGVGFITLADFDAERWYAQVELLEELGYDSVWLPDTTSLGGPAPLPALAAAAARTERLKLGTSVLALPARNPVLLARELATIDALSDGRMLPAGGLGVGAPAELAALGLTAAERAPRLEECVAILKALWPGEPVTRQGRFWTLEDVRLTPRPVRRRLELWLGGRAPAALRRIGRIADGWLADTVPPEQFRELCDVIRASAREADRTIDEDHYGAVVFSAPSERELSAQASELLAGLSQGEATAQVAFGTERLRDLLERFADAGASKFVLVPLARDEQAWLREVHAEVVAPIEARSGRR